MEDKFDKNNLKTKVKTKKWNGKMKLECKQIKNFREKEKTKENKNDMNRKEWKRNERKRMKNTEKKWKEMKTKKWWKELSRK